MKNNVIKKNKTVNSYCSIGLLAGAILVALLTVFGEFKNEKDRLILAIVLATYLFVGLIANIYFWPWKISFDDEVFKIRRFFFTKTYKREEIVAIDEPREHRGGARVGEFGKKFVVVHKIIRRRDNNRLIAEIHDSYWCYELFNNLKTLPKNKMFLMSYKHNKVTPEDFGLVERDGRYFSKKDGSEWIKHPMFDLGDGPENGFYKLPLDSFNGLIEFIEGNYEKDNQALCAAVMLMEMYRHEVKKYLLKVIKNNINSDYRNFLNYAFIVDALVDDSISDKELKEWEHIGRCLDGTDFVVYEATLVWATPGEGGRKGPVPMENNKYAPQIGIKGQTTFNGCAWSIICYNYEKTSDYTTRSYLRFLNYERAPNILVKGTMFELYEGRKLVAKGVVEKITNDLDVLDYFDFTN